jgi:hypothetical protein
MKKIIFIVTSLFYFSQLIGSELSFPLLNSGDSCQFGPKLWLIDTDDDKRYETLVYGGCPGKAKVFTVIDNSIYNPSNIQKAVLVNGEILSENFLLYLFDSGKQKYTHSISHNDGITILDDYIDVHSGNINYEEADKYFFSKQVGNMILLSKKEDINVLSVIFCNIQGQIIYKYNSVNNWYHFYFNLTYQSSGIYFIIFKATTSDYYVPVTLMKRIVFLRN